MDFNQSLQHQWSGRAQNSPQVSPKRGHNTLESPKRPGGGKGGLGSSMSNLLDSPRRSIPSGNNLQQPQPTLSRANQFRRLFLFYRKSKKKISSKIDTTVEKEKGGDKGFCDIHCEVVTKILRNPLQYFMNNQLTLELLL